MSKNIIIVFWLFSVTLLLITFMAIIKPKKEENLGTSIAIMVYDDTINDYVKTNEIPKGNENVGYKLNEEKSKCITGGIIDDYDSKNGTIEYIVGTADECYLYFDAIGGISAYIMSLYSEDGVNDLYYHDGKGIYGDLEAGDDTYRYAGANPNNYVCFEGDDCTKEDNLYRIISVDSTTGRTKIIKYIALGNKQWNSKSGYSAGKRAEDIVMSLTNGTTYTNIWAIKKADGSYYTSSLNDYLNGDYLKELDEKSDLIEETIWSVGGANTAAHQTKNVKEYMDMELNNSATYTAKIGLMYASEYGYAALPASWTNPLYNYSSGKGNNWLLLTDYPFVITRYSDGTNGVFVVDSSNGYLGGNYVTTSLAVYPSFNLKSDVKITNAEVAGVGSKNVPMIIGK